MLDEVLHQHATACLHKAQDGSGLRVEAQVRLPVFRAGETAVGDELLHAALLTTIELFYVCSQDNAKLPAEKAKPAEGGLLFMLAERAGFEPAEGY